MAFPHRPLTDCSLTERSHAERSLAEAQQPAAALAYGSTGLRSASPSPRCPLQGGSPIEGEHQLEKLEFALALALTRGDQQRSRQLRDQIEALGGNREEPGT